MEKDESDLKTAFKVVAIMQTITEDLDEYGKRAWRKMLGIATPPNTTKKERDEKKSVEKMEKERVR